MESACSTNWEAEAEEEEEEERARLQAGKQKGKSPLGRSRLGSVDTVKMDLGDTGWGGMDWIGLA
jgi:hypothetical protein